MKLLLCIILSVFVVACSQSQKNIGNDVVLADVIGTLSPTSTTEYVSSEEIFDPVGIFLINDRYLIVRQYADRDFLRILSLPDLEPLYTWGTSGRGPGEFRMPPLFFNTIEGTNELIISDVLDFRQEHFIISDTAITFEKSQMLRYEGQYNMVERLRRIDDSTYISDFIPMDAPDSIEYIILRPDNDQVVSRFGKYPITDVDYTKMAFLSMKSNAYNSEKGVFAAFYMSLNAFKLFRKDGELIGEYMVDGFRYEAVSPEEALNYTYRYIQDSSNDHIYTLGVYGNSRELYEPMADYGTESIFEVWDWTGNSLRRYKFDRFIHAFAVSEKHGRIYGYSLSDPTKVFEYELPVK